MLTEEQVRLGDFNDPTAKYEQSIERDDFFGEKIEQLEDTIERQNATIDALTNELVKERKRM